MRKLLLTLVISLFCLTTFAQEPCNFIYVTPAGNSTLGTKANPSSLSQAITEINASPGSRKYIRMQNGNYSYGNIVLSGNIDLLQDGITIEGGFNINWEKTGTSTTVITIYPPLQTAVITGVTVGQIIGINIVGRNNINLRDFTLNISNTHIGTNTNRRGHSVYGIYAHNSPNLVLLHLVINGANATNGGAAPAAQAGVTGTTGICGTIGDCDLARAEGHGGGGGTGGGNTGSATGGMIGTEWDNSGVVCTNGVTGGTGLTGSNVRMGGNGGGGGSGSRRGLNGGRGGCGGAGANGVTPAPSCAGNPGSGGAENCSNDNCNAATDRGRTGSNGITGAGGAGFSTVVQGVPGTFSTFYIPILGTNGTDGAGGSGGQGGGGGAGEPNFFDGCGTGGCSADDGSGAGGGGGGGGGQGGEGGQGGGAGGSSFCLYTSGTTTYTISQCVLNPGTAGTGTIGATGGAGGTGGVGGRGAAVSDAFGTRPTSPSCNVDTLYNGTCALSGCSNGETGAGGAGGRGGNGGKGGDGQGGTNGVSRGHHDVTLGQQSSSTSIPPFPSDVRVYANKGCTNSEITFNKTTPGTWNFGTAGTLTPDVTSGSTSYNTGQNSVIAYYVTTGPKNISVNAQTFTEMITIVQPRTLPVLNVSNNTICINSNLTLSTPTTGTNYLWEVQATPVVSSTSPAPIFTSNQQNPAPFAITNAGTYQVRLKVYDDCCGWSIPVYATVTVTPAVTQPSVPSGPLTRCQGTTIDNYTTFAGNATGYTWSVSPVNAGSVTGASTTGTVTWDPNFSGTAQVCVSALGCGGPTTPECVSVIITPTVGTPTVPSGISVRCPGATIDTFTTSATDALSYTWTVTAPNVINGSSTDGVVTWDPSFVGVAQVCVTATGCGTSAQVCHTVTVNNPVGTPSVPVGNLTVCQGALGELYTSTANNATGYSWSVTGAGNIINGTSGTGTADFDANFSGTAQVCVSALGCGGPTTPVCANVTVTPTVGTPTTPSGTSIRCMGAGTDNYTSTSTDATGYNWTIQPPGAGTISPTGTVTWNPLFTGVATVSVNATGCNGPSATSSLNVTVNGAIQDPTAPVGTLTRCQGIGSDNYTAFSPNATSYSWSLIPANAGTTSGTTGTGTVNWNGGFSGTVSVCVTAIGCGNSNQICTTVTVNPLPPVPTITPPGPIIHLCQGQDTVLISSSTNNNLWSPGNETTAAITVSQAGTYSVTVSQNNCTTSSSTVTVVVDAVPPQPTVTALGNAHLCPGQTVSLISSATTGNNWSTGANSQGITVNQPGVYTVTVTNSSNCSSTSDAYLVYQSQIVSLISGPDTVCPGDTISLSVGGGNQYDWNTGATTSAITVFPAASTTYSVNISDTLGCSMDLSKTVTVKPGPVAEDDIDTTYEVTPVSVPVLSNDTGPGSLSLLTNPQNGTVQITGDSILYTPVSGFIGTDQFSYMLCGTECVDACDTAVVTIVVQEFIELFFPDAFSPNGDGFNDTYVVNGLENYPGNELIIINRWGDLVYKVSPYDDPWDGRCNTSLKLGGDHVTDGTYFYSFFDGSGNLVQKGFIEIRR